MNVDLSPDQQAIRDSVREFAREQVAPGAAERDQTAEFPVELVKQCAEMGLMGVSIPTEWEGAGLDSVSYALVVEELSAACASVGVIVSVNNSLACEPILDWGTDEQKKKYLTELASGRLLGAYALSEPASGSDAAALECVATLDGDHYVLNGAKNWVTNGVAADLSVVYATTDREAGHKGVIALLVEKGTPGFEVGPHDDKLGIRCSGSCQYFFDNCRIPVANRLGDEGSGFKIAMRTLDSGRIGIAAQAVGIGRASFEAALAYSKEREAFGKPISKHQAIQFMLADMATEVESARLLTWKAGWTKDQVKHDKKQRWTAAASVAKLHASEVANRAATKAIQVFGGNGYVKDYPVERHFRDARITEIYEGTSEIQRIVLAADVLARA